MSAEPEPTEEDYAAMWTDEMPEMDPDLIDCPDCGYQSLLPHRCWSTVRT